MSLKVALPGYGRRYLESFQSAFTDHRYPSFTNPNPRRKIATGKTLNSLRVETNYTASLATIKIYANESYDRIIEGQSPGTLPATQSGTAFVLDTGLAEWADAVGFLGSDEALAFSIQRNGIAPANITGQALQIADSKNITNEILTSYTLGVTENIINGFLG